MTSVESNDSAPIRAARERLDRPRDAYERAKREDDRRKTSTTKKARQAAMTTLRLAALGLSKLLGKEYGL